MSTSTTSDLYRGSFSEKEIQFLSMYAAGATLEQLARDVLGEEGSYMTVCGRAFRYKHNLLLRMGIDPTLPQRVTRSLVKEALASVRECGVTDETELQTTQFKSLVRYLQNEVGLPDKPVTPPEPVEQNGYQKVLVLSDLHVPFHHNDLLVQALRDHADAHTVVILGDFLDMYSASRFARTRPVDPMDELRQAAAILEFIASRHQRVVVLEGNHDTRAQRWLQVNRPEISPLLLHPFDYLRYVWRDGELMRRYPNVEFPRSELHVSGPLSPISTRHFTVLGDALLGHFERSLKGPAKTVHTITLEWLPQWEGILFERDKVRVVVQAHVHRLAKVQWGKYTLFECGCMADIMQYVLADTRYHPPQLGYVVLYQKDGVTDTNRSHYISYDMYARS